jgi:tetratricopeptide (TPR) repeat protein
MPLNDPHRSPTSIPADRTRRLLRCGAMMLGLAAGQPAWCGAPSGETSPGASPSPFKAALPKEKVAVPADGPDPYQLLERAAYVARRYAPDARAPFELGDVAYMQLQAGDAAGARATLEIAASRHNNDPIASIRIARLCARSGDRFTAHRLLLDASAWADAQPDNHLKADTLVKILQAVAEIDMPPMERSIWQDAIEATQAIDDQNEKDLLYCALASGRAAGGDFERAMSVAPMIDNELGFRDITWLAIAEAQAKAGDAAAARQSAQTCSDPDSRDNALAVVAKGLAAAGKIDEALAIVEQLPRELRDTPLASIVMAQAAARDVRGAQATFERLADHAMRVPAALAIASAQDASGDVAGAKARLRQAAIDVRGPSGLRLWPEAEWIDQVIEIATAQRALSDQAGARDGLRTALEELLGLTDDSPELCAQRLPGFAHTLIEFDDRDGARIALERARRLMLGDGQRIKPQVFGTPADRVTILVAIARDEVELDDRAAAGQVLQAAKTTALEIESPPMRFEALVEIAKVQSDAGDTAGASQTLPAAVRIAHDKKTTLGPAALVSLAAVQAAMRDEVAVEATLAEVNASDFARAFAGPHYEKPLEVFGELLRLGRTSQALELAGRSENAYCFAAIAREILRAHGRKVELSAFDH